MKGMIFGIGLQGKGEAREGCRGGLWVFKVFFLFNKVIKKKICHVA